MTLSELKQKERATVVEVGGNGALRQHFLDMGMIPGVEVMVEKRAPMGDPIELRLHGFALAMRSEDAQKIIVSPLRQPSPCTAPTEKQDTQAESGMHEIEHPGLGEEGRYHEKQTAQEKGGKKMPKKQLSFALVGNQNCGKTTLFNQLTGARQHVGNFPGVTVERKDGTIRNHPEATVTDLPGIYSLSPYTNEEIISRRHILESHPDALINIVDATNIERNLYLTMQLMELDIPMVLALNMMDEIESNGGTVRINEMERMLGIPVIPISAIKGEGIDELVKHALHIARYQEKPMRQDFCHAEHHGGAVHRCLHAIMHLIEDHAVHANIPLRFAASKLAEGDAMVSQALRLDTNEQKTVAHIVRQMEEERGLDCSAALADMRYNYIGRLCQHTIVKPRESKEYRRSRRIDSVLTGKWTALPAFLIIMAGVFYITFNGLGAWLQDLCQQGIDALTAATAATLEAWNIAPVVRSLIIDGIFGGVGTVLVFLPMIITLFFFLSMLEDSGYMARIAFVMDKLLRKVGLSGRSIVPLLIGFGCSVPSVMASRILPSERDRRLTIMLIPFMSCTAKIPVYALFAGTFFPGQAAVVMMGMYLIGIVVGILTAMVLHHTLFKGKPVPFVMELPNYRLPAVSNVMRLLWDKARDFLQRAFTVIFLASMVIWFMQTFDFRLQMVGEHSELSMLAQLAGFVSPIFEPMGFGDWRITTALVSGFLAKEVVVSTLGSLMAGISLSAVLTAPAALSLMVFCLLYTPCVATISTIRRELGTTWAVVIMCAQCLIAWCCAALAAVIL